MTTKAPCTENQTGFDTTGIFCSAAFLCKLKGPGYVGFGYEPGMSSQICCRSWVLPFTGCSLIKQSFAKVTGIGQKTRTG